MLFSHDIPFFINREENACFEKKVALQTLIRKREEKGFDIACWFVGHFHGEYQKSIENVNFVLIGSQTAYVPTLWDMPKGGYFAKRQIGTVNEDLWDACVLDKQKRLIKLIRFGAGIDREIHY